MQHTKSAAPYVALLIGLVIMIPYANYQAQASQQIAVEVESKVVHLPEAQVALLPVVTEKP